VFPTLIPTEYNPLVFHRESCKKITGFCHIHRRITDGVSDSSTDGITDGLSHACLTRVHLHEYRWHFPTSYTDGSRMSATCPSARIPKEYTDGITDGSRMSDTWPSAHILTAFPTKWLTDRKVWQDFLTFLVRILINFRRNYRQKLIAPTAIKFRR
jgi:hypothetical protein